MQFSNSSIDAIKEKMPFQSLTRIVGEPDQPSLHNLYKEVKANAAAVHSTLGGGQHGHLGLVVPATTYAHLSNTPWIDPIHPGADLIIPAGTAQHQANHLRDVYSRNMHRFQTAHTVITVITGQIKQAIEEDFLADEVDIDTGRFNANLRDTIQNLFAEYGNVKPSVVQEKLQELQDKHYDPSVPLAATFARIEALCDLAEAARVPYTLEQRLAIAIGIIERTGKFGSALKEWYALPVMNQTWPQFKTHFKEARNMLKKTGQLDINNNPFLQANNIREMIYNGVKDALGTQNPVQQFCGFTADGVPIFGMQPPPSQSQENPPPMHSIDTDDTTASDDSSTKVSDIQSALAAMSNSNIDSKLQAFEEKMLRVLQDTLKDNASSGTNGNKKLLTNHAGHSKYCWSHGLCNHTSKECKGKKDGHKEEATCSNRMNGSNKGIKQADR